MTEVLYGLSILLRLRLRLLSRWGVRKYTRSARAGAPVRMALSLLLIGYFVSVIVVPLAAVITTELNCAPAMSILAPLLEVAVSGISVFIFFYALAALSTSLTSGRDLDVLLLSPLPSWLVVGEKAMATSLGFSGLLFLAVPGLLEAGMSLGFGPLYAVMVVLAALMVPLLPVSLAILLLLGVLRWLPAARVRAVTAILGTAIGFALYVGTQLLFAPAAHTSCPIRPPTLPDWLPTTWTGHALAGTALGQPLVGWGYGLAALLLNGLLFGTAIRSSTRLFSSGWLNYGEVARRSRSATRGRPAVIQRQHALPRAPMAREHSVSGAWRALAYKDWLTLRRDPQRLMQLIWPLFIVAYSSFQGLNTPGIAHLPVSVIGPLLFVLLFAGALTVGILVPSLLNGEGSSLYLLALAPLSTRSLLLAKWVVSVTPVLLLFESLLVIGGIALGDSAGRILLAAMMLAAFTVTTGGISIVFNLLWPRLSRGSTRRQGTWQAAMATMGVSFLVGSLMLGMVVGGYAAWPVLPIVTAAMVLAVLLLTVLVNLAALTAGTALLDGLLTGERQAI